jgi:hypothetical protein
MTKRAHVHVLRHWYINLLNTPNLDDYTRVRPGRQTSIWDIEARMELTSRSPEMNHALLSDWADVPAIEVVG